MDLISLTLGLPLAPVRGLLALARLLQEEAELELYSPTEVRRQVDEIEAARSAGELSDDEAAEETQEALNRLVDR